MNKQELIKVLNRIMNTYSNEDSFESGVITGLATAIAKIGKLDEPTKVEPLIVPKFLADWYEESKDELEFDIFNLVATIGEKDYDELTEIEAWFNNIGNDPIETIMKMKLFGYKTEKEKLYRVELPSGHIMYVSGGKDKAPYSYMPIVYSDTTPNFLFTEAAIKAIDERYWPFAVEVAE